MLAVYYTEAAFFAEFKSLYLHTCREDFQPRKASARGSLLRHLMRIWKPRGVLLNLVLILWHPFELFCFEALYLKAYWSIHTSFFKKLYDKIITDHIPKTWCPNTFRRGVVSENNLKKSKNFRTKYKIWLAQVVYAHDRYLYYYNRCKVNTFWIPTS